jgi:two-component system copper resistance phosphate regulon response regulator CusR
MKILIVEDEKKVSAFIKKGLEVNGFETDVAFDGKEALNKIRTMSYDAVIMDINVPEINGFDLTKLIRSENIKVPIVMLTALGTIKDKVKGFELGTDDYLVKPFEFEELLARIKAVVKRATNIPEVNEVLRVADLELDLQSKSVKRSGRSINLTLKEFNLLEYLMRNEGKVLSRADIAEKIWDLSFDTGTNIIDLYIYYLRKKVDKDFTPKLIHTQVGMGYVLKQKQED